MVWHSRKEVIVYSTGGTMILDLNTLVTTWTSGDRTNPLIETFNSTLPDLTV
jgi:hypothetical protein